MDQAEALKLVEGILQLENIRILGLMTMAPYTEDQAIIRQSFRGLRIFRDEIKQKWDGKNNLEMKYLSMGMSSDYEIALEEGSNMVRIGSAIFK